MPEAKYLLVGSSHAALEALRSIRHMDPEGSMAMITRDAHLPYSPTILPYVVSGRSKPDAVLLRDQAFFEANHCAFVPNAIATGLNAKTRTVTLESGETWRFERLLIGTGAAPAIPPVKGLDSVKFHVLRSLDDAKALRTAMGGARHAVVLGAGLVGLHAAETMAEAGLSVSVVEMQAHVLPGYFDPKASERIEGAFDDHGVKLFLSCKVVAVEPEDGGHSCLVHLEDSRALKADLLLVATGVKPVTGWLEGSGVQVDKGVLVDETMRTTAPDVWAAGDVAQAMDFHTGKTALIGIIPTAVDQGRIAGAGMASDPGVKSYPGGIPVNTYRFFGRVALSIGQAAARDGVEVAESDADGYRRLVLEDNRLVGYASVDQPFDVGIMGELIRRKLDLSACKDAFLAKPVETGRRIMSEQWR
ncbi:phenylglyoxylate dehydrogenase [Paramagnetospirillum marisnigri]|uniref:Phenylglyoxylate dehydrogenase n=1 Tax=Paramagnetospirillum marisnigri TaxID=1285242 RepID=A0A178M930_9PROT|nr:FAD-dependent oxidoreductase [Paramagnetospirillum marisnigri]OAN44727.1 phenylglyoxylate dehydrogenase [Paramagnetospirillum marisnigri]